MYWLLSFDALIRIALAMAFLFVVVPALALPRIGPGLRRRFDVRPTADYTLMERLFWNLGVGITLLTIAGQLLTLASLFSLMTILLACLFIILLGRATYLRVTPWSLVRGTFDSAFLALLNIFDGRVNIRRRIKRSYRRWIADLRERTQSREAKIQLSAWIALTAIATGFRLYRPLASANLGFSDTYVHLYLVKLLEEGQQVDPAWGPYPRGMHFLLAAIHYLTNVDQILLMNYFGVFVGVLITLGVADAARRLSGSLIGGLIAGFLFATLVGGAGQYFILGGAFETADPTLAGNFLRMPYRELFETGSEFDIVLTAFHRQTSTLSQELAIALLFPAAMFLLDFFKKRDRWHLIGFAGCTAAIAAVHSGVILPLIMMCAVMLVVVAAGRSLAPGTIKPVLLTGLVAVLIGSDWSVAFIAYPYAGGKSHTGLQTSVANAAFYYFPFLRPLASEETASLPNRVFVSFTPLLIFCVIVALIVVARSFTGAHALGVNRIWIAAVFLMFLMMHFASMLQLPRIVETMRNSQWLLMSMCILIGVASTDVAALGRFMPRVRVATASAVILVPLLVLWITRVPRLDAPTIHNRIVNYSGYGGTALAVLRIERAFEPYTWTLVSYGQEFPMVLKRGFHVTAADFLERYDPGMDVTPIPTPQIFVVVEKTAHRFQINTWKTQFSRSNLEERLETWMQLYQITHRNARIFYEDENVRVYQIQRTPDEISRATQRVSR